MLEAITDFWKPVKKNPLPEKLKLTDMQIGSVIGFGYVPQSELSGKKIKVKTINSYRFGDDTLTSFVLDSQKGNIISIIIAEAQGEQYLAISHKISEENKNKLFDKVAIDKIISDSEESKFSCNNNIEELKGWLVSDYKREIQGMKGHIYNADFRKGRDNSVPGKEFEYTLLGSSSNEHAIEIEKYKDGKIDIYATIYRRTSDIAEVVHEADKHYETSDSDLNLIVKNDISNDVEGGKKIEDNKEDNLDIIKEKVAVNDLVEEEIVASEIKPNSLVNVEKKIDEDIKEEKINNNEDNNKIITKNNNEEKSNMTTVLSKEEVKPSLTNGQVSPSFSSSNSNEKTKELVKENRVISSDGGDSVECELRVANQIIDEAIRNEMRLSDVVRRIIELPVSHQESVHLPIALADEDYALLAIRYGIPASNRNAIKSRIVQELGDFSGSNKKA
ncbi:MAG: hypothetical protein R3D71_05180 [Rickettsiales bacterium]